MKRFFATFFFLVVFFISNAQNVVTVEEKDEWLILSNPKIQMGFNLGNGFYYLKK